MAENNQKPDPDRSVTNNESADNSAPKPDEANLLDEILRQTKQTTEGDQFFNILVKFCEIHSDRFEMTQELMTDIVHMILQYKFPKQELPKGCGDWIAEILFFDAASRERVESVWKAALNQVS